MFGQGGATDDLKVGVDSQVRAFMDSSGFLAISSSAGMIPDDVSFLISSWRFCSLQEWARALSDIASSAPSTRPYQFSI